MNDLKRTVSGTGEERNSNKRINLFIGRQQITQLLDQSGLLRKLSQKGLLKTTIRPLFSLYVFKNKAETDEVNPI